MLRSVVILFRNLDSSCPTHVEHHIYVYRGWGQEKSGLQWIEQFKQLPRHLSTIAFLIL